MQTVLPGLHASAPQALSFAPSLHVGLSCCSASKATCSSTEPPRWRTSVLRSRTSAGPPAIPAHSHEADIAGEGALGALGAPPSCHEADLAEAARTHAAAATFAARHMAVTTSRRSHCRRHAGGDRLLGTVPPSLPLHRRHCDLRDGGWAAAVLH